MPELSCPECNADWAKVAHLDDRLSGWGYDHVDRDYQCTECHAQWMHGEPQGRGPSRELDCPVCEAGKLLPHKIHPGKEPPHADMKCPRCYYWTDDVELLELDNGEYAFGYPGQIGNTE